MSYVESKVSLRFLREKFKKRWFQKIHLDLEKGGRILGFLNPDWSEDVPVPQPQEVTDVVLKPD